MSTTITVKRLGEGQYELVIDETVATLTTEVVIDLGTYKLPAVGRVLTQETQKSAGTAATADPQLATATGASPAAEDVITNGFSAPALPTSNRFPVGIPYRATKLYHRSKPDAGADNTLRSRYRITAGWGE